MATRGEASTSTQRTSYTPLSPPETSHTRLNARQKKGSYRAFPRHPKTPSPLLVSHIFLEHYIKSIRYRTWIMVAALCFESRRPTANQREATSSRPSMPRRRLCTITTWLRVRR